MSRTVTIAIGLLASAISSAAEFPNNVGVNCTSRTSSGYVFSLKTLLVQNRSIPSAPYLVLNVTSQVGPEIKSIVRTRISDQNSGLFYLQGSYKGRDGVVENWSLFVNTVTSKATFRESADESTYQCTLENMVVQ